MKLANALRFAAPLAIGVAILVAVVRSAEPPQRVPAEERTTPVRVVTVPEVALVPRVRAYGTVRPKRIWNAVAEVGGRVVEMHPKLREGAFMRAGTLLLRIDAGDFELAIAQTQADIEAARAQFAEVDVKEANARASLAIELESLALSSAELERIQRLSGQGAVSRSDLDAQERARLAQRQSVTSLENTIRLIPTERSLLDAQIARYEAQLGVARRDLERTRFVLPFDARIAAMDIELDQSLRIGDVPVVAHDISVAEVLVDIELQRVRQILRSRDSPLESFPDRDVGEVLGVTATVRLTDFDLEWPARFARLSAQLDPKTRTVGAIVEVDEPYRGVVPGERPPLVKDMFVQVDFRAAPRPGALVVPRSAVRDGRVHVVDGDDRLEIRTVGTGLVLPEAVEIKTGIQAGERVVVSELAVPVPGMRLAPFEDADALAHLIAHASGQASGAAGDAPQVIRFFAGHPTAASLLMVLFLGLGLMALPTLQRATLPDFTAQEVEVRVVYPGASAVDVEEAIRLRIEDAVDGISGVDELRCEAREGVGIATVEMREGADFARFLDDVKTEVEAIDTFPVLAETPVVNQLGRTDPVVSVAVTGVESPVALKALAEQLKADLQRLAGVSLVTVDGFSQHQFRIALDEGALRSHGLGVRDVAHAISRQSIDLPAGLVETRDLDVLVRFTDLRRTPADLAELVILGEPGGAGEVLLGEVATIADRFELDEAKVLLDGQRAAVLRVEKNKEEDVLTALDAVRAFVETERERLPPGVELSLTADRASIVRDRLQLLVRNGIQGTVLVFLVMWLFFHVRFSFWVTMGLPVSFLGGLFVMSLAGMSVNMLSMVALLVGIGLLMDDAIVIAENVATHISRGERALGAVVAGVREVMPGVVSSFLTTAAVFGPLAFLAGDIGKVLAVVPVVLIIVLSVSLVEAFAILPNHLAHTLARGVEAGRFRRAFDAGLERFREDVLGALVDRLVERRYAFVGTVLAILMITVSMVAGGRLGFKAFPDLEGDTIEARVLLPPGTPLARTESVVADLTGALTRVEAALEAGQGGDERLVRHVTVTYNKNVDAYETGPHVVTVSADLLGSERRAVAIDDVINAWRTEVGAVPDVVSLSFKEPVIGPGGKDIEVRLTGPDLAILDAAASELRGWLGGYRGVNDVFDDLRQGKLELRLRMKPGALALGVDAAGIAAQVRAAFQGETAVEIQIGVEPIDVDVQLAEEHQSTLDDLEYFRIVAADGSLIPLRSVAEIEVGRGIARVQRIDGQRTVTVEGSVDTALANAAAVTADTVEQFVPGLRERYPGIGVDFEGQQRESAVTGASLARGFLIGLAGVYLLLSFQFRSYVEPVVVMLAIPLAFIGVVWGHLAMGLSLSMPSMVGFVSLAGIVVNDSILLVQAMDRQMAAGAAVRDAATSASRARMRAVLLTSLTTIAGLLPLLSEKSLQAQVLIPLATSIVFGLLASTLLILLVLPAVLCILEDLGLAGRETHSTRDGRSPRVPAVGTAHAAGP